MESSQTKFNAQESVRVSVLFFGILREATGAEKISLTNIEPATVESVKREVFALYPSLASYAKSIFAAVNFEYASDAAQITSGDEIAFFPPVSGG